MRQARQFGMEDAPGEQDVLDTLGWILERPPALRSVWQRLYLRSRGRCEYCGRRMWLYGGGPNAVTRDHATPSSGGGKGKPHNLRAACFRCNQRKGVMSEAAFRALLAAEIAV
ncbi:MAG: HNH endonuclease signature motif containing protein [Hyphomicrobiales bacterium]|nr:HNH endonuclease signature motif containing protein [Hyphomicrobiales bacterium]